MIPAADLTTVLDGPTWHMRMACPHHTTEADFDFADMAAAEAAYGDSVEALALTHEERFHCGCAAPHLTRRRMN